MCGAVLGRREIFESETSAQSEERERWKFQQAREKQKKKGAWLKFTVTCLGVKGEMLVKTMAKRISHVTGDTLRGN